MMITMTITYDDDAWRERWCPKQALTWRAVHLWWMTIPPLSTGSPHHLAGHQKENMWHIVWHMSVHYFPVIGIGKYIANEWNTEIEISTTVGRLNWTLSCVETSLTIEGKHLLVKLLQRFNLSAIQSWTWFSLKNWLHCKDWRSPPLLVDSVRFTVCN